jgi:threonylcarbamoyladenosine tRNA methylthiotransferase MtaB
MKYYKCFSLGCKVNTYETQAVCQILNEHGYHESKDDQCDLIVINTCAVTLTSESKSRQKIRSLRSKYPNAILFVMGCYSQLHGEEVIAIEGVDIVIGTSKRNEIISLIEEFETNKKQIVNVEVNNRNQKYECLNISSYNENTRAFLKIQDGCNNFCSYCVIPYVRGNIRSRSKEDVLSEVDRLVENGYQEIVLTGIDMASYGEDLNNETSFNDLIRSILKHNKNLKRLRISSLEASLIDDEFISLLNEFPQIARHLHIPLQSGSKEVLKRMNRKYTKEQFLENLIKIRKAIPEIALACDVIVGFPGESEEEFEETYSFIKECGFNYLHVFPYSIRPGTVAAKMKNQVNPQVKKERVARLIELGNDLKEEYESKFVGREVDVIVETYNPKTNLFKGYSSNYLEVHLSSENDVRGKYLKVIYNR